MQLRLLVFLLASVSILAAQSETESAAQIKRLLDIGGSIGLVEQSLSADAVAEQMRSLMKPESAPPDRRPAMERFIREFSTEFSAEAKLKIESLKDELTKLLTQHYTPSEIKALIDFYETPVGKKFAVTGPKLTMEIMKMTTKWGQEIGERVGARVTQRIEAEDKAKKN